MTFEEMEKSLIALRDNLVVQGQILNRVELAQERNTEAIARIDEAVVKLADGHLLLQSAMKGLVETVEQNSADIARSSGAIARNSEAIARHGEKIAKLDDGFVALRASLKRLADTVDRFIKGLGADGRRRRS